MPYFKFKVKDKTAYLITLLRKTKKLVFTKIVNKLKNLNPLSMPAAKKTEKVAHEERDSKVYLEMRRFSKESLRKAKGLESIGEVLSSLKGKKLCAKLIKSFVQQGAPNILISKKYTNCVWNWEINHPPVKVPGFKSR